FAHWRPDWSWSWARYKETLQFGVNRMASGCLLNGRQVLEQGALAGTYDFSTLGVFTRSLGLSSLVTGRIGTIIVESLYPVITRAERRSDQFQRAAGLVLNGVAWVTIPAGTFLAITASDMVLLLYGPRWADVILLLPIAAAYRTLTGIGITGYNLL